ncbi:MAG: RNA polymerase sigma factor [Verrucomicrobiota bacterium]
MDTSDSELMNQLAHGDDLALNALMNRWGGRVAAFLHKMTGEHATSLDLAQETFVRLYQSRGRYRASGNFSTWLFAIAANLARNHARWKSRHPTVSLDAPAGESGARMAESADPHQDPREAATTAETTRAVHAAFLRLPADLREAMTLFVYEGMGYAEIAEVAGCSTKAVETRIYRARRLLREELEHLTL